MSERIVAIVSVAAPRPPSSVGRSPHERVAGSVNTFAKLDTLGTGVELRQGCRMPTAE